MMHTTETLYTTLHGMMTEINKQIDAVKREIMLQFPENEQPSPDDVYMFRLADGSFPLSNLLAAKAQVLSGMAALKAADLASKTAAKAPRR